MTPVVELKDLSYVYVTDREAILALEEFNVTVSPGEFISLVGPSGCGKSTLLSVMAGLLAPSKGEVFLQGKPIHGPTAEVGYMLQQDYLFPWRTIFNNATIGLEITGRLTKENLDFTRELLTSMGLGDTENMFPHQLSGGMRRRVALVRTLTTNPDLLLLDEPFSALDYQTKLEMEDLVVDTLKKRNKTGILVTHDLSEAIAMSDRVIVLASKPGRIKNTYSIPDHIRNTQPFFARKEEGFNELFHEIWQDLESIEEGKG